MSISASLSIESKDGRPVHIVHLGYQGIPMWKVDVIDTSRLSHREELIYTCDALDEIMNGLSQNVAAEASPRTRFLSKASYEPRTEWTSGHVCYQYGPPDSFLQVIQSGALDIKEGLQAWIDVYRSILSQLP